MGKNADFPDEQYEIGALLGYPVTAAEYFLRRLHTMGTPNELPAIELSVLSPVQDEYFSGLVFSPDYYKDEIMAYCLPLEDATRKLMPKTYKKLCEVTERSAP